MTALKNFESLANTMKDWSTSAGDHHWQAGCAIEQLATENNFGKKTNAACCVIGGAAIINNAQSILGSAQKAAALMGIKEDE